MDADPKSRWINYFNKNLPMITLTESAVAKIADILLEENNPQVKLRTFVQGGGCSGCLLYTSDAADE